MIGSMFKMYLWHRPLCLIFVVLVAGCGSGATGSPPADSARSPSPAGIDRASTVAGIDVSSSGTHLSGDIGHSDTPPEPTTAEIGAVPVRDTALSPIDSALGVLSEPSDLALGYYEANRLHAENITACMRDNGFDYTFPMDPRPTAAELLALSSRRVASETELIAENGYGPVGSLRAQIERQAARPEGGNDRSAEAEALEGLSESERNVFWEVRGACMDESADSIRLPDELPGVVAEEVAEFRRSLWSGAEITHAWSEWARCMRERGFAFSDRWEISEYLAERVAALGIRLPEPVPAEAYDSMDALEDEERRIMAADVACAASVSLDRRIDEYIYEQEVAFVEANADRLIALSGSN